MIYNRSARLKRCSLEIGINRKVVVGWSKEYFAAAMLPYQAEKFLPTETESQTFTSMGLRVSRVSSFPASQDPSGLGSLCTPGGERRVRLRTPLPRCSSQASTAMPPLYRGTPRCPQTLCLCITRCSVSSGLFPSPGFTRVYHSNVTGCPTILLRVRTQSVLLPADGPRAPVPDSLCGT